ASVAPRAAQACGAELERAGHAVGKLVVRSGIAAESTSEYLLQFGLGGRVDVVGDPAVGRVTQFRWDAHARIMSSRNSEPIRLAAARPASTTSSWLSGCPDRPAARLLTRDSPKTSRPSARAWMASSTVRSEERRGEQAWG